MYTNPALIRLEEIVGNPKKQKKGLICFSRSKWLAGVKEKKFPQPVRIDRCTFWRASDIYQFINNLNNTCETKGGNNA